MHCETFEFIEMHWVALKQKRLWIGVCSHQVTVGHEVSKEREWDGEGPHHEPPVPPVGSVDQAGHHLLYLRPPAGKDVTNIVKIIILLTASPAGPQLRCGGGALQHGHEGEGAEHQYAAQPSHHLQTHLQLEQVPWTD